MQPDNTNHTRHSDVQAQVVSSAIPQSERLGPDHQTPLDALTLPHVPWGLPLAPMCHLAHLVTTLEVVHPSLNDPECTPP